MTKYLQTNYKLGYGLRCLLTFGILWLGAIVFSIYFFYMWTNVVISIVGM